MLYLFCENYQHNASYLTCLKEHSSKSHCDRASSLRVGSQASQMRKSVFTVTNYWTTEVWGLLLRFKWTFKGEKENLTYQKKKKVTTLMAPHNCIHFHTQSKNIIEYWYFHFQPPVIESATNQNYNFRITFNQRQFQHTNGCLCFSYKCIINSILHLILPSVFSFSMKIYSSFSEND